MELQREPIKDPPFMRNVGLLLTYYCQASCAHCIIRAGPDRHEEMDPDDARQWISQIAAYRDHYVYVLSLTGGEPFSNLTLLRHVMKCAADSGLYVSIATNAFWATSRDEAKALLQSLPDICFLSISTDLYHQKFISFECVRNAIWAAQQCGVPFYVTVITENEADPEFQQLNAEIVKLSSPENVRTGITFPAGRASHLKSHLKYKLCAVPPKEACQAASSPCIFPDGRVYGCIGPLIDLQDEHPLLLGNLRHTPLDQILDRSETNAVLHALRLWGPQRLISMLKEAGLSQHLPFEYVSESVCNACYSLLSNSDVREWLSELDQDPQFRRKVAYGRSYYLNETTMLELGGCR